MPNAAETPSASSPEAQQDPPPPSRRFLRDIPNQITLARLVLALVFFVLLILDNYGRLGSSKSLWLNVSLTLFIVGALSDVLDGYLARRWNVTSTFGRIADPIVDKVLVCGAFILLTDTSELVAPWIPVVIVSREFLVSGLRGYLESIGIAFGADVGGKLKMACQSVTIPVILFHEANFRSQGADSATLRWVVVVLLGATILLTVVSCVHYVVKATRLLKERSRQ